MRELEVRRAQLRAVADAYFAGLANKDVSRVPWAEDVVLHTPLAPEGLGTPLRGREEVLSFFRALYPVLGQVSVQRYFFSDDLTGVCVEAEVGVLQTPPITLRVADCFTVDERGTITSQENHYDPRGVPAAG